MNNNIKPNYSDLTSLYTTLIKCSNQERSILAFEIQNNSFFLNRFINSFLTYQESNGSNSVFFFMLDFGAKYVRIPFLIALHETRYFKIIEKHFSDWKMEEKKQFKAILENIMEIFLEKESAQINSISSENFIHLYKTLFKCEVSDLIDKKMKTRELLFQTDFEKLFNKTKIQVHQIALKFTQRKNFKKEEISFFYKLLAEINICITKFKTATEISIMRDILEEKQNLMNFLNSIMNIPNLKGKLSPFAKFNDFRKENNPQKAIKYPEVQQDEILWIEPKVDEKTHHVQKTSLSSKSVIKEIAEILKTNETSHKLSENIRNASCETFKNTKISPEDDIIWINAIDFCSQEKKASKLISSSFHHPKPPIEETKEMCVKLVKKIEKTDQMQQKNLIQSVSVPLEQKHQINSVTVPTDQKTNGNTRKFELESKYFPFLGRNTEPTQQKHNVNSRRMEDFQFKTVAIQQKQNGNPQLKSATVPTEQINSDKSKRMEEFQLKSANILTGQRQNGNSQLKPATEQHNRKLEDFQSFEFESHLPFLESEELEFKNYSIPLQIGHFKKIKKTVCAFLNSNGGRIYFGVRDEDQCVIGIQFRNRFQLDDFRDSIKNALSLITPEIRRDQYFLKFLPVMEKTRHREGCFVPKLIIKRGDPFELYFTNERLCYYRRNGNNSKFSPLELKSEILKREKIDKNSAYKENCEYNRKFNDLEEFMGEEKTQNTEKISEVNKNLMERKRNYHKINNV